MSRPKSSQTTSTSSNASARTPCSITSTRRRMAQNYLLIWVDSNIDGTVEDCQDTLMQLRSVINDVTLYTRPDECIRFLHKIDNEKVFVIISGSLGEHFVPNIHDIPTVEAIYIFCGNKSRHEKWTKTWVKIKGVHTNIKDICKALQMAVKQCNQDSIAVSFVSRNAEISIEQLNQLEPTFMYTQIFKEIFLEMKHDKQAINDLARYCRQLYPENKTELDIIDEFDRDYRPEATIWWYTRECFTYQMLNRALRTLDGNIMIKMGFFIHDLHRQIQALHHQQLTSYHAKPFVVYRGQGLSKADFEKLSKTQGGLMSFSNFLSTSKDREVSLIFAKGALGNADMVGILFVMSIDPKITSAPFAAVKKVSYFKTEKEILFSMHTVFRVDIIQQMAEHSHLYQVRLRLTADDDEQLRVLTKRIGEETGGGTGWERLGNLMLKIGQFDKAEELYSVLLEQTSDESEKGYYYHQLGIVKNDQDDHKTAIWYYEKALEIKEKTLLPTDLSLATSYNNIACVYKNMGEYAEALSFHKKALDIREKTLPATHSSLAISYNNIGGVHKNMGEYSKALLFYQKALDIREETLPATHPSLATSYNNIACVYINIGEYSKALLFYDKALQIFEKTLPPTHPDLTTSYNNIGSVYRHMEEYSKALSFYQKALEIEQTTLPAAHLSLATSYNNIGMVYDHTGEYSKALAFYDKALEIVKKTLPSTHPHLAASYNNIGSMYYNMGEYSKALPYFERARDIRQAALPASHPELKNVIEWIKVVTEKLKLT